ncbi:hypothetical protein [Streptomyces tritici]|uniref:hypothetical protein n=1 Tax=Streptomyces tritici TaxID=2054410 RepID=UPI003AF05AEC
MRSGPIALRAAGAAAAVLVLTPLTGVAQAGEGVKATVTPSPAKPGADVDLRVKGCKGATGTAASPAFVADAELSGRDGGGRPLFGDTTLKSDLNDGTYRVTVTCDGREHRDAGSVRVEHRAKPTHKPTHRPTHRPTQRPTDEPTHRPPHRPTEHTTPVAPVRAGGGGAALAAPGAAHAAQQTVEEQGPGTPHTLIGLGLAGIAAVAVAFRHTRRRANARAAAASAPKDAE